jgi:hypothetical protein
VIHLAQVNIARMRGSLDSAVMADFVARLDETNALLRRRHEWFSRMETVYAALWWAPAGHRPSIDEATKRLAHLEAHGPAPFAFTFKRPFPPDDAMLRATDWSSFEPCPAASSA